MKAALTRRDTLVLGAGAVAAFTSPSALAQQEPERHGISAFGDLKYPADFGDSVGFGVERLGLIRTADLE